MTPRSGATRRRPAARRAALALCCVAAPAAAQPAAGPGAAVPPSPAPVTIEVTVTNVRSDRGQVRVAVCPRASFLQPTCPWHALAPAHVGSVTVAVNGVPPGVYAVQSFQDENGDGRINRGLLGIPTEGVGFSNDAPIRFGPPSFDDAAIRLGPAGGAVSLRLRYFD